MIIGIGVDIIEIKRMSHAIEKRAFVKKVFTKAEIGLYEDNPQRPVESFAASFAANFAAKEAVVKAFGTGFSNGITPLDIEVLRDNKGKPFVNLLGNAKAFSFELGVSKLHVSLSHCKEYAIAMVELESL